MADTLKADDRIPIPTTPVSIPRLGFGTYQILGIEAKKATLTAIQVGYGQIDSAQSYRNESQVQAAVSESGVPREDLFLTTKVYFAYGDSAKTYQNALSSIEALGGKGGYADLVLIHTPGSKKEFRQELWATLEKLHAEGRAKTIGVSNYRIHHIEEMKEYAKIWPPHVQQIEVRLSKPPSRRLANHRTASPLVPAAGTRQLLPHEQHRHPGIQSALQGFQARGSAARFHRRQVREAACPGPHPLEPAEGLGTATQKRYT